MLLEFLTDPTAQAGSQPAFAYHAYGQVTGRAYRDSDKPQETQNVDSHPHHKMLNFSILSTLPLKGAALTTFFFSP